MEENRRIRLHSLQQFNNVYSNLRESQEQVCNTLLQDIGSLYRIHRLPNQQYRVNRIQVEGRQQRGKRPRRQRGGNRSSSQDCEGGEDLQQRHYMAGDDASRDHQEDDDGDSIHLEIPSPPRETLVIQPEERQRAWGRPQHFGRRQQHSGRTQRAEAVRFERHPAGERQQCSEAAGTVQRGDDASGNHLGENIPLPPPILYTCPLEGCERNIQMKDMWYHIEREHVLVGLTCSSIDTLTCSIDLETLVVVPAIFDMMIDSRQHHFYAVCQAINNGYLVSLLFIGDKEVAKNYCYTLEVGRSGHKCSLIWNGAVKSILELDDVTAIGDGLFVLKSALGLFGDGGADGQGKSSMTFRLRVKEWII